MKLLNNILLLGMFTASLVLFTVLTLDIINFPGQQGLLWLGIWLIMGLISFTMGKAIILLNPEEADYDV